MSADELFQCKLRFMLVRGFKVTQLRGRTATLKPSWNDTNHVLHLVLSLLTFGFWVLPWLMITVATPGLGTVTFRVTDDGRIEWHGNPELMIGLL